MSVQHPPLARARTIVLAIGAVIVLGYVVFGVLYNPGGEVDVQDNSRGDADISIRVDLVDVTPADYEALLRLRVLDVDEGLLGPDGRLRWPLRLSVSANDGVDDIIIPASSALAPAEDTVGISGSQSAYPFDSHGAAIVLRAAVLESDAQTGLATAVPLSVGTTPTGGTSGWDADISVTSLDDGGSLMDVHLQRSPSTRVFALMLVAMALVLGLFSAAVGVAVAGAHQPVDSSILGWGASLVFALLAVRFYLPGQPPIGSGIDVFGYVWITLLAFIGLALTTAMWLRRRWEPTSAAGGEPSR